MTSSPRRALLIKLQRQSERYTYAFVIAGKNLKLRSSANGTVYQLCDIDRTLPETIDCHGIARRVKLVLKLYARVDQASLKRQRENRRYQALLHGKIMLSHD